MHLLPHLLLLGPLLASAASLNLTTRTTGVSPKKAALLPSLLIGNDGSAATGGVTAWSLSGGGTNLTSSGAWTLHTGRTKLVSAWNGTAVVTISQEDSFLRVVDRDGSVVGTPRKLWGDFSAVCGWREGALVLVFAKELVKVVRIVDGTVVVVATWDVPIEAQTCGVSESRSQVYFAGKKNGTVYTFPLSGATAQPETTVATTLDDEVQGIAVYHGKNGSEYLFMAHEETLQVFDIDFNLLGEASYPDGVEVGDIALYQPESLLAVQMETDDDGKQYGIASFSDLLQELDIEENTDYDAKVPAPAACEECGGNGFCAADGCDCFEGYTGDSCAGFTCLNECSAHGNCTGNNVCACESGWDGPDCSFFVVTASYETDPVGEDGDDPAIWIHPSNASLSRIITTTKSTEGAGLTVFDLTGKKVSSIYANEPNNVDVIYNFPLGSNRTVDLAYAACRGDDTLCIFEISSNGTLLEIAGGSHPTPDDYSVYGSCVYSSQKTGKHYLFVNSKTAQYLQYELSSTANGTLVTTLVRTFQGGSGGQVEGCVGDDENGVVFIGEEPRGLWRYEAEPDGSTDGVLVDSVDGNMYADIEGVTLVNGRNSSEGYVIVSCQGVSAYNVYDRAPPNAFRMTFTIHASADGQVDGVTNTDGVAAVGKRLNGEFPYGLLVTHDDVNQNPDGSSNAEAAFKLVSLETVLKDAGLLDGIDQDWDPRAA